MHEPESSCNTDKPWFQPIREVINVLELSGVSFHITPVFPHLCLWCVRQLVCSRWSLTQKRPVVTPLIGTKSGITSNSCDPYTAPLGPLCGAHFLNSPPLTLNRVAGPSWTWFTHILRYPPSRLKGGFKGIGLGSLLVQSEEKWYTNGTGLFPEVQTTFIFPQWSKIVP